MNRPYLLLRNNKKTGPFSFEELEMQCLKPMDLVWVEGKSAGWSYPGEIRELKSLLSVENSGQTVSTAEQVPATNNSVSISESKPEKKSINKKIFISYPANAGPVTATYIDDTPEEKLRRKAEQLFQRAQAFNNESDPIATESEMEVKYCRSLGDIKSEYSNWLQEQKKSKRLKKRTIKLASILSLLVIAATVFFINNNSGDDIPNEESAQELFYNSPEMPLEKKTTFLAKPSTTKSKSKTSSKKHTVMPPVARARKPVDQPASAKRPSVALPEMIRISGSYKTQGKGVGQPSITVKNNSDEIIRVLAVNVIYYKADGSELAKEILYFRELSPGQSKTLKAPANKKAEEVRFRTGLISGDESGIYYAMQ